MTLARRAATAQDGRCGRCYRGRFAPSPTGELHLGGASTALCAWLAARAAGGAFVIRLEDIDTPRVVAGAAERILEDLRWLGLDWDEGPDVGGPFGPYVQSARTRLYAEALEKLTAAGHTYACDCSRAEIAGVASAPHPGEEGPAYRGTCRALAGVERRLRRPAATRLAVPPASVVDFEDRVHGPQRSDVARETGDFVLRRGDGLFAYQLAVVVDDAAMGITEVVRGADLLGSTARQILLARLLGLEPPRHAHAPLLLAPDGSRLAKRERGVAVRHHREAGQGPRRLVALLAGALGLCDAGEAALWPAELVERFRWDRVARTPVRIPEELMRGL
jgi:glutamyl-tRNA synthetase